MGPMMDSISSIILPAVLIVGIIFFKHTPGELMVGSAYTVTALGTLLDAEGEPVALLTGQAIEADNPEKQVELFTNRAGRFAAQGLAPGERTIEMATEPVTRFALTVPDDAVGLFRAGALQSKE